MLVDPILLVHDESFYSKLGTTSIAHLGSTITAAIATASKVTVYSNSGYKTGIQYSYVSGYKFGRVATLTIAIAPDQNKISATSVGWKNLGTVVSALIPYGDTEFIAMDNNDFNRKYQMRLKSNGELWIWLTASDIQVIAQVYPTTTTYITTNWNT